MKLHDWIEATGILPTTPTTERGAVSVLVAMDHPNRDQLWTLDDYEVKNLPVPYHQCVVVWLEPKRTATTVVNCDARNRDFERVFTGDKQQNMTHFYSIGHEFENGEDHPNIERFAYGYFTPDGIFHQGIARWNATHGYFLDRLK